MRHFPSRRAAMLPTLIVPLLMALLGSGCATVFPPQPVVLRVTSNPEKASVMLDGERVGVTPCFVRVPVHCDGRLTFELPGYEPAEVTLQKKVHAITFLNFAWLPAWVPLFFIFDSINHDGSKRYPAVVQASWTSLGGLVLFFLIDGASGNMTKFRKDYVHVELRKKEGP